MKRLIAHIALFTLIFFTQPAFTQIEGSKCPWDEVDCPGKCGRYYDVDGDDFCDYGRLSIAVKPDTVAKKDTTKASSNNTAKNNTVKVSANQSVNSIQKKDVVQLDTVATSIHNNTQTKIYNKRHYSLLFISLICLGLYGVTSFLYDMKLFRKFAHRRIWNMLLLLTFLTTAVLGIILVIQINYNISLTLMRDYLYWHVQFGIAMTIIALIHIIWHWKYFKNILLKKSKTDCS